MIKLKMKEVKIMFKTLSNTINIKDNYRSLNMEFVFNSMLQGNSPAEIYVNSETNPTVSIVCEEKVVYFGGESSESSGYTEAIEFFKEHILLEKKKSGLGFVKIIYSSEQWEKALLDSLKECKFRVYDRVLFRHKLKDIPEFLPKDKEIYICEIEKQLLERQLANTEMLVDEINGGWGNIDNFYEKGFGFCAVKDKEIVGWCTGEYMSEGTCGIGIETIESYQNLGVAASMTSSMISKCSGLSVIPHWDSWKWNAYSVKTAEKVGFEKVIEYKAIILGL
jgi:hypothetical protein